MVRAFADIRPEERRGTAAAFLTLFGILAGYTILETARDALFLARLPPSQLPWVYLAMAAIAVGVSQGWGPRQLGGTYGLATVLLLCAGGTLVFWVLGFWTNPWTLRALYVWTGLVSTLTAVQFWLVLGEVYTITQAKRLYKVIGLGSLLGAVAGGALARFVSDRFDAHQLVLAAAVLMALTGIAALLLRRPRGGGPVVSAGETLGGGMKLLSGQPYLARLAGLILISTVAVTLADYVFKSTVSRTVPPQQLGSFFATFYTVLNVLALGAQLLLVGFLMRVLGLHRALWVLPVMLFLGAAGVVVGGGLVAALLLKGADGALRPSLQRMGTELLFLPVTDRLRSRAKPLIDVLGQRGGQALASIFILAEISQHRGDTALAVVSGALCVLWIAWIADLRPHYLEVFRGALRQGSLKDQPDLPELDLGSLEVLFAGLNSGDDAEVLGAIDLLAAEGRTRLIPALALFHPSRSVVFHALSLFGKSGRTDFVPIADRLLVSPDPEIRAAALRARAAVQPEEAVLRAARDDESLLVRATSLVGLVAGGWVDLQENLEESLEASVEAQVALARAIESQPTPAFTDVLLRLADAPEDEVLRHVAHAMGKIKSEKFLPKLLLMLAPHGVRNDARNALLEQGDPALRFLADALGRYDLPHNIRRHVPRTISRFPPQEASGILLSHLLGEPDGMVRFRILRGLGRIVTDHPFVTLDRKILEEARDKTIAATLELIHWRTNLARGVAEKPLRATPGQELLVTLLRDKEVHALERLFRLLGLLFRGEDFYRIHRGLRNTDPKVRAGSRELLENLLEPPLRDAVLALVDDVPDEDRLARARPELAALAVDYDALLATLLEHPSETLRSLAAYHAGELGLKGLWQRVEAFDPKQPFATRIMEGARGLRSKREGAHAG
jgi:AAA family ATP:ADP antiporter